VGAVGDAFEFAKSGGGEGELVFDVGGAGAFFRVVGEFVFLVFAKPQAASGESDGLPPLIALIAPELVPLRRVGWMNEELDLHLLEFARAEREIPRRDFIAERLA